MPAKPRLGQNFLIDMQAAHRIVAALGDLAGHTVVEIGPGQGAITGALATRAGHVIAIELDRESGGGLAGTIRCRPVTSRRVTVVEQDVLQFDFACGGSAGRESPCASRAICRIYITSPILLKLASSHAALDLGSADGAARGG